MNKPQGQNIQHKEYAQQYYNNFGWGHMVTRLICCCCSVTKLYPTLCDPMDWSTPSFPALHYLPEFVQTHTHWVGDAKGQIQLKRLSRSSSRWSLQGMLEEGCLSALSGVVQESYLSCFWMRRVSWADAVLSRPCTRVSDDWIFWTRYSLWPNLLLRWYLLLAWKKSINSSTLSCLKKKIEKTCLIKI